MRTSRAAFHTCRDVTRSGAKNMSADGFNESSSDPAPPTVGAAFSQGSRILGGLVALVAGFGLGLGGLVLHFAEKAGRVTILALSFAIFGRVTMVVGLVTVCFGA